MRAPQHEGVDLGLLECGQVLTCHRDGFVAARHSRLHEFDEARTRLRVHGDLRCCRECVDVRPGCDGGFGSDNTDAATTRRRDGTTHSWMHDLNDGNFVPLASVTKSCSAGGVAGDD